MRRSSKFETIIIIVILLVVGCVVMMFSVNVMSSSKMKALKLDIDSFSVAASTYLSTIDNESNMVFLEELIDEGRISNIRSPFSANYCDLEESKFEIINGEKLVTLKCDEYLVDRANTNNSSYRVYKIGTWHEDESYNNDEKSTLYNCVDYSSGAELFKEYVSEEYLLYKVNKQYEKDYKNIDDIEYEMCNVQSKVFYRLKSDIEDKS